MRSGDRCVVSGEGRNAAALVPETTGNPRPGLANKAPTHLTLGWFLSWSTSAHDLMGSISSLHFVYLTGQGCFPIRPPTLHECGLGSVPDRAGSLGVGLSDLGLVPQPGVLGLVCRGTFGGVGPDFHRACPGSFFLRYLRRAILFTYTELGPASGLHRIFCLT